MRNVILIIVISAVLVSGCVGENTEELQNTQERDGNSIDVEERYTDIQGVDVVFPAEFHGIERVDVFEDDSVVYNKSYVGLYEKGSMYVQVTVFVAEQGDVEFGPPRFEMEQYERIDIDRGEAKMGESSIVSWVCLWLHRNVYVEIELDQENMPESEQLDEHEFSGLCEDIGMFIEG